MSEQTALIEIQWLGHACFRITSAEGTTVVTDPYDDSLGLKLPDDLSADLVTVSHQHFDHNHTKAVKEPFIQVKEPGVFVHKDVAIKGISSFHDLEEGKQRGSNLVFSFSMQGVKIVHLGDLGHVPNEEQLAQIGQADVLLIPIGGFYTMEMEAVLETIRLIHPTVIIPMHYKYGKLGLSIGTLESFTQHFSQAPSEKIPVFAFTKEALANQTQQIVILQDQLNQ